VTWTKLNDHLSPTILPICKCACLPIINYNFCTLFGPTIELYTKYVPNFHKIFMSGSEPTIPNGRFLPLFLSCSLFSFEWHLHFSSRQILSNSKKNYPIRIRKKKFDSKSDKNNLNPSCTRIGFRGRIKFDLNV